VESGFDVVDGEVDGDVLDADGGAQLCDDALVDLAGDLVDALAVADGEGEVDDRGAAQDADRGVGGAVAEGGFLGQFGDLAVVVPGLYYRPLLFASPVCFPGLEPPLPGDGQPRLRSQENNCDDPAEPDRIQPRDH
jgi:hypothetical protein